MPSTRLTQFVPAVALGIGLAAPGVAAAQEPAPEPVATTVETDGLPVSFDRIKRRMAATEQTRDGSRRLLNLNFYVDVYARAPAIRLLRDIDPDSESVPYGAPTHLEMLNAATPREWRPRAISTGNLFGWR